MCVRRRQSQAQRERRPATHSPVACLKKVSSQKFHDVDRNQWVNPLAIGCRDMSWKKQPLEHNRCYANFAYLVSCWMLMRNEAQLNGLVHSSVDLSIDVGQFCCFGDWIVNVAFDKVFFVGKIPSKQDDLNKRGPGKAHWWRTERWIFSRWPEHGKNKRMKFNFPCKRWRQQRNRCERMSSRDFESFLKMFWRYEFRAPLNRRVSDANGVIALVPSADSAMIWLSLEKSGLFWMDACQQCVCFFLSLFSINVSTKIAHYSQSHAPSEETL